MATDYLIVGQGLAGSLIAWQLEQAGASVLVVDPGDLHSASRVAPGIINPLAGRKLHPCWKIAEMLPCALKRYAELEAVHGMQFLHKTPIVRVIKDAAQIEVFQQRTADPEAAAYIGETLAPCHFSPGVHDPFGSFIARESGWLDSAALTVALRQSWLKSGKLSQSLLSPDKIQTEGNGIRWNGKAFACCIFCEGWRAETNHWFDKIPWNPARGEILDLRLQGEAFMPADMEDCILNCGQWLLPLGNGCYRAGASYAWDNLEGGPTAEKENQILAAIHSLVNARFDVIGHSVGVRPIVKDRYPVIGRHPDHPQIVLFNGLGSKGVLMAPWLAQTLAQHLLEDQPLPAKVDLNRFFT